eukprot:c26832_g1_i1 orf=36-677(+)
MSPSRSIAKEVRGCRNRPFYVLSLCYQDCFYVHHRHHQLPCTLHNKAIWAHYTYLRHLDHRDHHSVAHLEDSSANSWQSSFNHHPQHPHHHCCDDTHLLQDQQGGKLGSCKNRTGIRNIYCDGERSPWILCNQGHHHHDPKDASHYPQGKLGSCTTGAALHTVYHDGKRSPQVLCKQEQRHHQCNDSMDASHYVQGNLGLCMSGTNLHYGYHG